uniref:Deoxyuridine 5'-triphosphate nucleotidohydrolase n=1 Tax=Kalanchoe fedtschenkoi TaxID=63787 RepID=A0A7N0TXQ6_KALFE
MAGIFGASFCKSPLFTSPLYNPITISPDSFPSRTVKISYFCNSSEFSHQSISAMAEVENASIEQVQEPAAKIQKLEQNGAGEAAKAVVGAFKVKKLSEKAVLPTRASPLSAGYDLSSAVEAKIPARGKALVPTDLSIAIPEGTYARIAPRSGLAWKHAIDVGAGVIDADYRGPVGVILFNHSDVEFEVKEGDRIAQLILEKILTPEVVEVEDLDDTVRGAGGFGSTGV